MKLFFYRIAAWVFLVGVIAFIVGIFGFKAWSKLQICKTYYPELNGFVCFSSHYGLPPKVTK